MKRILSVLAAILICLSLSSCGEVPSEESAEPTEKEAVSFFGGGTKVTHIEPDLNKLVSIESLSERKYFDEEEVSYTYMLNLNTMKFHYLDCDDIKKMNEENKKPVDLSREEIMAEGYSPCENCNP